MTADPHVIAVTSVTNVRDLGGRSTSDGGVVASGVAYRSASLADDGVVDDPGLAALGIRTVVDLRTREERTAQPDRVPRGAQLVELDVLADLPPGTGAAMAQVLSRPGGLAQALEDVDLAVQMAATYRLLVVSPAALAGYATLVRTVLDPQRRPVLFHCTAGKDRTGWAATVLLLAAGVSEQDVVEEFLAVNPAVRDLFAPLLVRFDEAGGSSAALLPLLEVRPEYLRTALDAMHERFGTFDGYLRDGLGLSVVEVESLRRTLRAE